MNLQNDFMEIMNYAHMWNWAPDMDVLQRIYDEFPESYSVLTPFAYTYLEELIRSLTSQYGREYSDANGNPLKRKVGYALLSLAIQENQNNSKLVALLNDMKDYFSISTSEDTGDNRNSTVHGYMHPRYWSKDSFEKLIHDIALLSPYAGF